MTDDLFSAAGMTLDLPAREPAPKNSAHHPAQNQPAANKANEESSTTAVRARNTAPKGKIVHGEQSVGRIKAGYDMILATDGACSGNPGPGGWAWVEQISGTHASGGEANTTNNIMELTALIEALTFAGPDGDILIRSDSQYSLNVMTVWAQGWRKRGWKKADKKPVANRELVQRLLALYEGRTGRTDVEWVKGHAGDTANEMCDRLAVEQSRAFA